MWIMAVCRRAVKGNDENPDVVTGSIKFFDGLYKNLLRWASDSVLNSGLGMVTNVLIMRPRLNYMISFGASCFLSFAIFVLFPKRLDDTWIGKSCCVTQGSAFGNVPKEPTHDLTATRLR